MSLTVREETARGAGAVAVLAIEGERALEFVEAFVARSIEPGKPVLVALRVGAERVDEAFVCARSRDAVELHLHGGIALVRLVREHLAQAHDVVPWRARTLEERALDLLATAPCEGAARVLLDQAHGVLRAELRRLVELTRAARSELLELVLERARVARFALRPARVVLAGNVNAGKSTLFNALLGAERAITSVIPGTTRDLLRERAAFGEWPVDLVDTAGERELAAEGGEAEVELAGQARARVELESADLVLWLVGPGDPVPVPAAPDGRVIVVLTHADLDSTRVDTGISARVDPARARAFVHARFRERFGLPGSVWTPGAAVPFEPGLVDALIGLRGVHAPELVERALAPWLTP